MAPQSCSVLREGAGVPIPHHQVASVVGVCSWVRWLSSTESNYGGRKQLESLIPRDAITAGRLSASVLKKASGEHCSVHYSPLCATWIHVLCTVSSGNSSSRILVDRFFLGKLTRGRKWKNNAAHIEVAGDRHCFLPPLPYQTPLIHSWQLCWSRCLT